ncbi:MAG: motility associated factor glycosyltransferase family protein, partial [Tepidisphaeraceae bacterium]
MVETPTDTADSSARFVLAEDAPYLRNLAALWAACPPLAREIEALDVDDRYRVEPSKAGPPTLAIDVGPRTVHLHSRHQPIDEARRLVDTVDHREKLTFYVHGFGLGYHAEMLFDRAGSESQLWVFEPDLQVLRAAFEHRDLSRLIDSRRVHFVWRADKGELFTRLMPSATVVSLGAEPVSHPASRQLHPGFFAEIERWLEEFAAFGKTSLNTLVLNGKRTAENVSRNAAWYAAAPGLARLKNAYKGQPAVVVSAGPSLRKNRHLLKEVDGKAVVVAVQTTLQPLVEMGVEPQFVTSLDYHDISTRFFEKLPPTLRTELVAEPKAAHAILGMHPGPMSLLGNEFSENLLREMNLARP